MTRYGKGFGAGSCGELIQGVTSDDVAFQVSLPIDIGATVEVAVDDAESSEIIGLPTSMTKTRSAISTTIRLLGASPKAVRVRHHTRLPTGRGLGSLTADIVAAARATADALGQRLSPNDLARLAGTIELSDGAMYDRTVLLRRRGTALRAWSWTPTFTALVLIPPATMSTEPADLSALRDASSDYDELLALLEPGVARRDSEPFLVAAAASARLHREIIGNRWASTLGDLAGTLGARGWNIAHTGTAAGLLFDATRQGRSAARAAAGRVASQFRSLQTMTVTAGMSNQGDAR